MPSSECLVKVGSILNYDFNVKDKTVSLKSLTNRVPSAHYNASIVWRMLDLVNALFELINALSRVICMHVFVFGAKVAPLTAVNGPQVTLFAIAKAVLVQKLARRVTVPYFHALVTQLFGVGGAFDEPEQLFDHTFGEYTLCGQQWQSVL